MARTIAEIKKEITDSFIKNETISVTYGLNSHKNFEEQFSKVSLESIIFHIVATAIWTLEKLFDTHKKEVDDRLARLRPHTLIWYRDKALKYRKGKKLLEETDYYNEPDATEQEIEKTEIVKYAAAEDFMDDAGRRWLRIKIATVDEDMQKLKKIDESDRKNIQTYFNQIKDAGVWLEVVSDHPDKLYGEMTVHYDPLVFYNNGYLVAGGDDKPVENAINKYLRNLPFNGEFSLMKLIDAVQEVEGVQLAHINSACARPDKGIDRVAIADRYTPRAGYMIVDHFDNDFKIDYTSYVQNEF